MPESPEAKQLAAAIAEQERIDKERLDKLNAETRAKQERQQNERDRALAAKLLREAAGES